MVHLLLLPARRDDANAFRSIGGTRETRTRDRIHLHGRSLAARDIDLDQRDSLMARGLSLFGWGTTPGRA
jgi:hypothetical protein